MARGDERVLRNAVRTGLRSRESHMKRILEERIGALERALASDLDPATRAAVEADFARCLDPNWQHSRAAWAGNAAAERHFDSLWRDLLDRVARGSAGFAPGSASRGLLHPGSYATDRKHP